MSGPPLPVARGLCTQRIIRLPLGLKAGHVSVYWTFLSTKARQIDRQMVPDRGWQQLMMSLVLK